METDFLILGYGFTARYAAYKLSKRFSSKKIMITARKEDFTADYSERDDYIFLRYGKEGTIRQLLEELGVLRKGSWRNSKKVEIGFIKDGKVIRKVKSEKIKQDYYEKVFDGSTPAEKLKGNIKHFYDSQRMVNAKFSELMGALDNKIKDKVISVPGEVESINADYHKVRLSDGTEVYYKVLISTIPLDVFLRKLIPPNLEIIDILHAQPLYYYPAQYTRMHGYDQLYVLDKEDKVLRFIKTEGSIIKETLESSDKEPIMTEPYGKLMINKDKAEREPYRESMVNKVNNLNSLVLDSFFVKLARQQVYLAGRVARWQSYHYLEDNIKDVLEIVGSLNF